MSTDLGVNVRKTPGAQATGEGTETILQTTGLTKQFGSLTAVDDVEFGVEAGERRCLIGPNGAGKSTLLNLIIGRLDPDDGAVHYDGRTVTGDSPASRVDAGIGMKFQNPNVYESLTVRANVRIPLQRHVDTDLRATIHETLERVGLEDRADDAASSLSHGQKQRLEIGMAVALEPKLLLLDEPVAGLSVEEREEVAALVHSLNEEGIAFVIIEHDIDFVERVAESVTVLHQGAIFREADVDAIRADPEVRRIYLGEEQ